MARMRSSRGPTGTFNSVKLPSAPVRVPTLMLGIVTSAPAMGSPVRSAVTLPWIVPVCAASGTARRDSNDATATAARSPEILGGQHQTRDGIGRLQLGGDDVV